MGTGRDDGEIRIVTIDDATMSDTNSAMQSDSP
jgi:hypothetical protein